MVDTRAFVDLTRGFFGDRRRRSVAVAQQEEEHDALEEAIVLAHLRQFLVREEWSYMRDLLNSMESKKAERLLSSEWADEFGMRQGGNFLHAVCSHGGVPTKMVRALVNIRPDLTSGRDYFGRAPLHVAVEKADCKGSLDVVRFLVSHYPKAAEMKDSDGMTPILRVLVRTYAAMRRSARRLGRFFNLELKLLLSLLHVLALGAPRSVIIEDKFERTPLEHAILLGAPKGTIKLLQKVSITVRRNRKDEFDDDSWN